MVSGTLVAVVCPILEDEVIHNITKDGLDKRVVLIDTHPSKSIRRKFDKRGIPYEMMDEWDFMNGYHDLSKDDFNVVIVSNELALHMEPEGLKRYIQDQLVMLQGRADALALYYGMCGNFGWDIEKWAESNLSYPVITFRDRSGRIIDDCIAVAVGGVDRYKELLRKYMCCLLVTPSEATNWQDFMESTDTYGGVFGGSQGASQEQLKTILDEVGYRNMVKIDTGLGIKEDFESSATEYSEAMGLELIEAEPGWPDIWPTNEIHRRCLESLEQAAGR